ncbi:MAG: FAD-dependent oxidoreductase [Burkholderiales bacterium]|nr:FAD-dependent oxidoreductase [Burkholderiales bacterium]
MYQYPTYEYRRPPELDGTSRHCPVVVVGAGPVGLTVAIDLAQRGIAVLLIDDDNTVSMGSRAICYSKRTLEILDRLGCGETVASKGVRWHVGKVYQGSELAYQFDLLPDSGHRRPAFVNLQQYHFEECLVRRAQDLPALEIRWRQRVSEVTQQADRVDLSVTTDDGEYALSCDWLIACDGARSPVRQMLGLDFEGQVFRDRFLIADIHMTSDFPAERRFWFDPPFHPNQSVLLHRQPDDIWRVDFQLGWDADPELEKRADRIMPRLRAMLGPDARFEIEWASVYTFSCRRMQKFRHGRLLFAGDSAHLVSPFGARGANSGIQDADNLAWKLELVLRGLAPEVLLDSYDSERVAAADESLANSTRATDFITPKSPVSRCFRDAVLALARRHPFARGLVNSGRLSVPSVLARSPLNTADRDTFAGAMLPGTVAADAPVEGEAGAWLLEYLGGGFVLLVFGDAVDDTAARAVSEDPIGCRVVQVGGAQGAARLRVRDVQGLAAARYDGKAGTCYLLRPDQHVCARWRAFDADAVRAALACATAQV